MDNSFAHIFDFISSSAKDTQFLVHASYYEIYNEEYRDLLIKVSQAEGKRGPREPRNKCLCQKPLSLQCLQRVRASQTKNLGRKQRAVASTNNEYPLVEATHHLYSYNWNDHAVERPSEGLSSHW